ncbi:MAG: group I intron-associated PD-(D/E)XK endonuclease [Candidatus Sulfotelmatobacter sp.]
MSTDDPNRRPRKPRKPAPRKNTKVTGERSEAAFLHQAANRGFGVAKPWGDSRRYDFILDNGACLHRVQVKCTESIRARAYETRATYTTGKGRAAYTKQDIDFIAAHVVPLDIWYIIPVEICTPAPMLRFYPHRKAKKMRLEPYREAWHLLQSHDDTKIEIQACIDEREYVDDANVTHVGTAAPGCPPSKARQGRSGAGAPARELPGKTKDCDFDTINDCHSGPTDDCHSERSGMIRPSESSPKSRNLLLPSTSKPVRLPKTAAPWPIPPLRILATRKGKHILPDSPDGLRYVRDVNAVHA